MKLRSFLLGSLSLSTLVATAAASRAGAAEAAAQAEPTLTFSVEVGLFLAPNYAGISGPVGDLGPSVEETSGEPGQYVGYRTAISLGAKVDNNWDLTTAASLYGTDRARNNVLWSGSGGGGTALVDSSIRFATLDVSLGFSPVSDSNSELRLFGGVRGLYSYSTQQAHLTGSGGPLASSTHTSEYLGVGPRIGLEGRARLPQMPFGVSGKVAGGVLYGQQEETSKSSDSPGSETTRTEWRTVYDIEAALGIDIYINDDSTLTIGYQAQQLMGLGGDLGESQGGGLLVSGPYVKLSGRF